eukprot:4064258-Prymnesium_polylepis.1
MWGVRVGVGRHATGHVGAASRGHGACAMAWAWGVTWKWDSCQTQKPVGRFQLFGEEEEEGEVGRARVDTAGEPPCRVWARVR